MKNQSVIQCHTKAHSRCLIVHDTLWCFMQGWFSEPFGLSWRMWIKSHNPAKEAASPGFNVLLSHKGEICWKFTLQCRRLSCIQGMTRKEWKLMDIEYLLSSFHCLSSFYIVNFIPAILPESKPLPSLLQMKPIENAWQTRVLHGECGRMKARTHQSFTAL